MQSNETCSVELESLAHRLLWLCSKWGQRSCTSISLNWLFTWLSFLLSWLINNMLPNQLSHSSLLGSLAFSSSCSLKSALLASILQWFGLQGSFPLRYSSCTINFVLYVFLSAGSELFNSWERSEAVCLCCWGNLCSIFSEQLSMLTEMTTGPHKWILNIFLEDYANEEYSIIKMNAILWFSGFSLKKAS